MSPLWQSGPSDRCEQMAQQAFNCGSLAVHAFKHNTNKCRCGLNMQTKHILVPRTTAIAQPQACREHMCLWQHKQAQQPLNKTACNPPAQGRERLSLPLGGSRSTWHVHTQCCVFDSCVVLCAEHLHMPAEARQSKVHPASLITPSQTAILLSTSTQ